MSTPKESDESSGGRTSKSKGAARRIGKLLPARIRKDVKRAAKKFLPTKSQPKRVAAKSKAEKNVLSRQLPLDPLALAVPTATDPSKGRQRPIAGRAAAGTELDPDASARLGRAMFGTVSPARTSRGGRPVAGIFGRDLAEALTTVGHEVLPFAPGISGAYAEGAEVLVIDLAGFIGVWEGALDPTGVALMREVMRAVEIARNRGVTCWLVVRGDQLHHHGAILLQGSPLLQPLYPGHESTEQTHFTENPGNVPSGIVQIIRSLEVAA